MQHIIYCFLLVVWIPFYWNKYSIQQHWINLMFVFCATILFQIIFQIIFSIFIFPIYFWTFLLIFFGNQKLFVSFKGAVLVNAPRSTVNINDFADQIADLSKFHNYPQGRELLFHIPLLMDLNYVFSEITQKHSIRCLYIENSEEKTKNPMDHINQNNEFFYHFTKEFYKTPEDLSYLKIVYWIREQYGTLFYSSFVFLSTY